MFILVAAEKCNSEMVWLRFYLNEVMIIYLVPVLLILVDLALALHIYQLYLKEN